MTEINTEHGEDLLDILHGVKQRFAGPASMRKHMRDNGVKKPSFWERIINNQSVNDLYESILNGQLMSILNVTGNVT